ENTGTAAISAERAFRHIAPVATSAARSSEDARSCERLAAVTAGSGAIINQPLLDPCLETGVKDVVTSKEHNSVATIATSRVAAVSVAASAAVAARATVTASCVAAIAARSETTDRAAR